MLILLGILLLGSSSLFYRWLWKSELADHNRLKARFEDVCKQRDECLRDLNAIFNTEE